MTIILTILAIPTVLFIGYTLYLYIDNKCGAYRMSGDDNEGVVWTPRSEL